MGPEGIQSIDFLIAKSGNCATIVLLLPLLKAFSIFFGWRNAFTLLEILICLQ